MPEYKPTRVDAAKLKPLVDELTLRCGSPERAAEYAGLGKSTFYRLRHRYNRDVNENTARLIVLALYQRRKEDRLNGASAQFMAAKKHQAQNEERLMRLEGY